jgi:hypothetical protein
MKISDYHAMAARLGSLPPSKLNACPLAVQKILEEDVPVLLKVYKAAANFMADWDEYEDDSGEMPRDMIERLLGKLNEAKFD